MFTSSKLKFASVIVALAVMCAVTACKSKKFHPLPASGAVAGWEKTSATHIYAAKDLWQYLDGEADKYVHAGVVSTLTSEYKYQNKLDAVADVYKMSDPKGATTIFNSSLTKGGKDVSLGDAGVEYAQSVSFRKGPYLVHIVAYQATPETADALMTLAHGIEANL